MTTGPSDPASLSESEPHRARHMAESFGSDPERYDRSRPRYPDAMVAAIIAASPGRDVLDVGVGTGIAAREFQAAGCRVLGVDVDARMADFARQRGVDVEVAAFETWDPAGRTFDTVISGQTWHWIHPVAGAAKAAQALRPGGRLAVFWNAGQPQTEVAEGFADVYRRVLPDAIAARQWAVPAMEGYSLFFTTAAEGIAKSGAFGEPEQWRFEWEQVYTRHEWLDQMPTSGRASQLPPAQLAELLADIGARIDAAGGSFTMRYTTVVITAARSGVS